MTHGWSPFAAEARQAWLRTGSAALLAGVATYFAGNSLWQPSYDAFVARAVVSEGGDSNSAAAALDLEAARTEITSDASLQAAIDSAGGLRLTPAALRSNLVVYRQFDPLADHQERFAIELTNAAEPFALTVTDRLARNFVQSHTRAGSPAALTTPDLKAAQARLAVAQAKEDDARRVLDSLTHLHFDRLKHLDSAVPAPTTSSAPEPDAEPSTPRENTAWRKLHDQIKSLEVKRDSLLTRLTDAHPLVKDVDSELQGLQARLAKTPQFEAGSAAPSATSKEGEAALSAEQIAWQAKLRTAASERAKYRVASDEYEAARGERLEAEAAVEVLSRSEPTTAAAAPSFALVQPAQIVDRLPMLSPLLRQAILGAASVMVALAMLAVLRPRAALAVLRSADDVEQLLGLPVVAKLPSSTRAA